MADLEFRCYRARFGATVPNRVVEELLTHCAAARGSETGGILIGEYSRSHDRAIVHLATGPTIDSVATRTTFLRGTQGLQAMLNRLWRRERRYYLGEWHFHPGGAPDPSGVDRQQLSNISEDPKYQCPEPILLIIGGNPSGTWTAAAFVFPRGAEALPMPLANSSDEAEDLASGS